MRKLHLRLSVRLLMVIVAVAAVTLSIRRRINMDHALEHDNQESYWLMHSQREASLAVWDEQPIPDPAKKPIASALIRWYRQSTPPDGRAAGFRKRSEECAKLAAEHTRLKKQYLNRWW